MSAPLEVKPTICRDCVFAKYDENDVQVDCTFHDKLWKLEQNGAKITLVEDDSSAKRYYMIEKRVCLGCHNRDSLKKIPEKEWKKHVEEFINLRLTYIIVAKKENHLEDLLKTINQAENQNPKPYSIIVIIDPKNAPETFDSIDVVDYLRSRRIRKWYVEDLSIEKTMKFNMKNMGIHYTMFFGGSEIPPDFSEKINKALNYDMRKIIALRPDKDGNGVFLQKGIPLTQIIAWEGVENYIKGWEEL